MGSLARVDRLVFLLWRDYAEFAQASQTSLAILPNRASNTDHLIGGVAEGRSPARANLFYLLIHTMIRR